MKVVIDGVKYKVKPEKEIGSCRGCVADNDGGLCDALSDKVTCIARPIIFKRSKEAPILKRYDMQVRFRIQADSQREAVARIKRLVNGGVATAANEDEVLKFVIDWELL